MQLQHVNVKLLVQNPEGANLEPLILVFHSWIESQNGDELLIDVADYTHVPAGPGIVLIGHEGNYSVDNTGNRLGVQLQPEGPPRRQQSGSPGAGCPRGADGVPPLLEAEPRLGGKIPAFNGQEIEIFINDRLKMRPQYRRNARSI